MKYLVFIIGIFISNPLVAASKSCIDVLAKVTPSESSIKVVNYFKFLLEKKYLSSRTLSKIINSEKVLQLEEFEIVNANESQKVSLRSGLGRVLLTVQNNKWNEVVVAIRDLVQESNIAAEKVAEVKADTATILRARIEAKSNIKPGLNESTHFTNEELILNGVKHYVVRDAQSVFLINAKTFKIKQAFKYDALASLDKVSLNKKEYFVDISRTDIKLLDPKTLHIKSSFETLVNTGAFGLDGNILIQGQPQGLVLFYYSKVLGFQTLHIAVISTKGATRVVNEQIDLVEKLVGPPVLGKLKDRNVIYQMTESKLFIIDPEKFTIIGSHKIKLGAANAIFIENTKYLKLNGDDVFVMEGQDGYYYNITNKKLKVLRGMTELVQDETGYLNVYFSQNKKRDSLQISKVDSFEDLDAKKNVYNTVTDETPQSFAVSLVNGNILTLALTSTNLAFIDLASGEIIKEINMEPKDPADNNTILDSKIVKNSRGEEVLLVLSTEGLTVINLFH